jgi:hypothetical protein
MADEQKLRAQSKAFRQELQAKAEALKRYRKAIDESIKAEAQYAKAQTDSNTKRIQSSKKLVDSVKQELLSLKLTEDQINKLYNLYLSKIPKIEDTINSFADSMKKMSQSMELSDQKKGLLSDDAVSRLGALVQQAKELKQSIPAIMSLSSGRAIAYQQTMGEGTEQSNTRLQRTLNYQNEILEITKKVSEYYQKVVQNQKDISSDKFKILQSEQLSADLNKTVYNLQRESKKLTAGAFGDLRSQLNEVADILVKTESLYSTQVNLNDELRVAIQEQERIKKIKEEQLAYEMQIRDQTTAMYKTLFDQAIKIQNEKAKREKEIQNEVNAYFKQEDQELQRKKMMDEKARKEQDKRDEAQASRARYRAWKEGFDRQVADEKQHAQKTKEAEREAMRKQAEFQSKYMSFIGGLPLGGLLSMVASLGPMFALIAAIVGVILFLIFRWDKHITSIQKAMSVTREEAQRGAIAIGKIADKLKESNLYAPQIAEAIGMLSDGLSGVNLLTPLEAGNAKMREMALSSAVLYDKFQLTGDELGNLADVSTAMGTSLSGTTIMVERMAKGSFNVRSIFQALAKLTPTILTSFRGSNAQLIAMAANAKRLGVEMGDIIQSSMSLLDVEDAISKAFEAQVVTGKNIDIDRLMFLQLTGDYGQVLKEQEKILKEADYINNKSPVFQGMIAGAIGLSQEQASQIALRSILSDRLGLSETRIREMQKRGESLQNVFDQALSTGKLTEMEFEELSKIAREYDFMTIQEKIVRALDNLALNIGIFFDPLTKKISELITTLGSFTNAATSLFSSLPEWTRTMGSIVGGIALGALGYGAFKASMPFMRGISGVLRGGGAAAGAAGAAAGGGAMAGMAGLGKRLITPQTLKAAGRGSLLGAGIDVGVGLLSGESVGQSLVGGGLTAAGAIAGGMAFGPAGAMVGGYLGSTLGDYLTSTNPSNQTRASAQMSSLEEKNNQLREQMYRAQYAQSTQTQSPFSTLETKVDTTNTLLRELIQKPTSVTVEMDGEKVGKSVMNYTSEVIDRNRPLGNTYGKLRDTTIVRPNR